MSENSTDYSIHMGWRDENDLVRAARQPFSRRVRQVLQVGGMSGFSGLPSEERMKANVDTRMYYTYPLLFYTAFPDVSLAQLRLLSLAGSYLFDFILCQDRLIDNPEGWDSATPLLCSMLQHEALSLLYSLFPSHTPFWGYFERYCDQYTQAVLQEQVRHRHLLIPYSQEELYFICAGKPALGKTCIAALALLGGREHLIAPFTASHDHFHVAYQLIDDLQDWRVDYRRHHYSYPLALAFAEAGRKPWIESNQRPSLDEVARLLDEGNIVEQTLYLALAHLEQAEQVLDVEMADGSWTAALQQTRRSIEDFRFDVNSTAPRGSEVPKPIVEWPVECDAEITVTPVAASWLDWLDPTRMPHVIEPQIRSAQQRVLCQLGGAPTIGEAICQIGRAIVASYELYPECGVASHIGISMGELDWCYHNRRWLNGMLSTCLDQPPCLWTGESQSSQNLLPKWAPPGLGRFLGYLLVQDYMNATPHLNEVRSADILRYYRDQLVS